MELESISLPPTEENVALVREFAREQGLLLWKVKNQYDLWDLRDLETKKVVSSHNTLFSVHDFLCHNLE